MNTRTLAILAGAVLLSTSALASGPATDPLNGGFDRASANTDPGADANIGASGATTSTNAQRNGIQAGESSSGLGSGAQMREGASVTGTSGTNSASSGRVVTDDNADVTATKETELNSAQMATVDSLPDSGRVSLRGIVQDMDDNDEFTLTDSTGSIEVELSSAANELKEGQTVTVVGDVAREWGKRELDNAMVVNSAEAPSQKR
jgi:uncharacterized protein YdeI (BOF family)